MVFGSLGGAGFYSAPAAAAGSAFCLASRSSPVSWSTTFIDRRTLPRSSKPSSLTLTLSPSLTTSVVLCDALVRELGDVDEAVLGAEEVHEGAEIDDLDDLAVVDLADFGSSTIALIHLIAASIGLPSEEAILIVPSSSMLILAPVFSTISRITLPPVPITSRILSVGILTWSRCAARTRRARRGPR